VYKLTTGVKHDDYNAARYFVVRYYCSFFCPHSLDYQLFRLDSLIGDVIALFNYWERYDEVMRI